MALPITGYRDFKKKFDRLKHSRDVFMFLLYDSGGEQEAVVRFIEDHFQYLDEHAGASNTFIFLFTPSELGRGSVPNPGPAVAKSFQIRPNQLPGVLVFCLAEDNESFGEGAYLELDGSLFQNDPQAVENAFDDLFSLIQEIAELEEEPQDQIIALRKKLERQQRIREMRPLLASIKAGAVSAIKYAGEIVVAVAPAWVS